ncbi:hypothetical protein LINPERPRIM_LOCUS34117 [Linum perenne]
MGPTTVDLRPPFRGMLRDTLWVRLTLGGHGERLSTGVAPVRRRSDHQC